MKRLEVNNKIITLYYDEDTINDYLDVIIINSFEENGQEIYNETKKICNNKFVLCSISNINWNKDMSPWKIDKLFKSEEEYSGEANYYLDILINEIIPKIKSIIKVSSISLIGYSLSGLFSIYSMYKTNIFKNIGSCSGSLWYPNIIKFINNNELINKPNKLYISLGNKESNTKNKILSCVKDNTLKIVDYYKSKGINVIYEENEGNHFMDVNNRIAKCIKKLFE